MTGTRDAPHILGLLYENWRFSRKAKYARLRTLTDVTTRPWRTPRLACRRSRNYRSSGSMEKINALRPSARHENYTTFSLSPSNRKTKNQARWNEMRTKSRQSCRVGLGAFRVSVGVVSGRVRARKRWGVFRRNAKRRRKRRKRPDFDAPPFCREA